VNLSSFVVVVVKKTNHVSKEKKKARQCPTHTLMGGRLQYLHDVFAVGTTIAPKVDGRLYDGAEQTGA
jgi:hypothetical protein